MKKILTTILAGTLVAGAAFAADAKITIGARTFLDAFSLVNTEDGEQKSSTRNWMDWNGYKGDASDDLSIKMSGDTFGATLALTQKIGGASDTARDAKNNFISLKQFSGWMKFNVGPGTLQLDGGILNEFVQGSFRVNKDGGIKEGLDFETFKLGSIFAGTNMKYVDDLAFQAGKKRIGGFASYGLDVAEGVNLKVTVGGIQKDGFDRVEDKDDLNDTTTTTWKSAFASNVLLKVKGIADVKFVYKLDHAKDMSLYHTFGLYAMPQILDALTLSVGGAAEVYGGDQKVAEGASKNDYVDWGVDLRMRYQVMDPFSITFFTNVSGTNLDSGRKLAASIFGAKGTGYKVDKDDPLANVKFKVAMWNHLTGQYKINDLLTASLDVGLITPLSNAKDDKSSYNPEWRVTPAVQIFPNPESGTSLWVGVAISGMSWTVKSDGNADVDHSRFGVDIPVIFRVKF